MDALINMEKPVTVNQLQQLVCATNWMRTSIPAYAETIAPLHNSVEKVYKEAGSRKKRSVRKIRLADYWGTEHDTAFITIKSQLASATKLTFLKAKYTTCLFTDASESHWAAICTQTPYIEKGKSITQQEHEPLCFISGAFTGASEKWSMPEKEGFAIVTAMCRMDYLLQHKEVSIFTDHANLLNLYDPCGRNPGVHRHTANKLMR